ncbi:bifunctional tryptophan synthase TRP1 [Flagelloscypha sp. PMI_526]|nr:bifunctional tryptophan synthase TRP1 [Flagelloscypha sp. PMI_526]
MTGRPALVTFITAGFPRREDTVPILLAMQRGGADVVELGLPFSDPLGDGPVIQAANAIAIRQGVDYAACVGFVKEARKQGLTIPVVLMGYYNPVFVYGFERAISEAADAGANGFIMADLPPEEATPFRVKCREHWLFYVPLISPATSLERIKLIGSIADGFVYTISKMGITGSGGKTMNNALPEVLARVKQHVKAPLAVGVGVSTRDHFDVVEEAGSDAVVIGSRILALLNESTSSASGPSPEVVVENFCREIVEGRSTEVRDVANIDTTNDPSSTSIPSSPLPSYFGDFGGRFVPDFLVEPLVEVERAHHAALQDPCFAKELQEHLGCLAQPTSLVLVKGSTEAAGGPRIWLKRDGRAVYRNAFGQALLARRLGKERVIADTASGHHGVAVAFACQKLGLECVVYMGLQDSRRHAWNAKRIEEVGAKLVRVNGTLKDAINDTQRDWVGSLQKTYYMPSSATGPHPFPTIFRDFSKAIGEEVKVQMMEKMKKLPNAVVSAVPNAVGAFHTFVEEENVRLVGVCAGGSNGLHSASLAQGTPGVLHGMKSLFLQTSAGQISATHSIASAMDYPGAPPELASMKEKGRAEFVVVDDEEAKKGFNLVVQSQGIVVGMEAAHAVWASIGVAKEVGKDGDIVVMWNFPSGAGEGLEVPKPS